MSRKILTLMITLVTMFFFNSNVWAATANTDAQPEFSSVTANQFLSDETSSFQVAAQPMIKGDLEPLLWLGSIFIPGLGQILMGDMQRGLKFLIPAVIIYVLGSVGGAVLTVLLLPILGAATGIIWTALYLVGLVIHVWSVWDAYQMSQEMGGMSLGIRDNKVALSF